MFVTVADTRMYYSRRHLTRSELYLTNVAANEANIIFSGQAHEWSSSYVNKRRFANSARGSRMRDPLSSIRRP